MLDIFQNEAVRKALITMVSKPIFIHYPKNYKLRTITEEQNKLYEQIKIPILKESIR